MLLKVGELSKRTGLTVRALHHYDGIGLLRPSARSDGGYRLYDRNDVARLHGIQALRRMGLSLAEVKQFLDGEGVSLSAILARQMASLEREMGQARALHERLGAMQAVLASGREPDIDDWLSSLSTMSTLEEYFSASELTLIFERWKRCEAEWPPLVQAVREAMVRGIPTDSIDLQPLARRWMDVSARWMDGDIALLQRWGHMVRERLTLPLPAGMDRALLEYIDRAVQLRLTVLSKYITPDELNRLDKTLEPEWGALAARVERLMAAGVPVHADSARQLAREWRDLLDRLVRSDPSLRAKLVTAYESEPLLRAGGAVSPEARQYLMQAEALDPDAT